MKKQLLTIAALLAIATGAHADRSFNYETYKANFKIPAALLPNLKEKETITLTNSDPYGPSSNYLFDDAGNPIAKSTAGTYPGGRAGQPLGRGSLTYIVLSPNEVAAARTALRLPLAAAAAATTATTAVKAPAPTKILEAKPAVAQEGEITTGTLPRVTPTTTTATPTTTATSTTTNASEASANLDKSMWQKAQEKVSNWFTKPSTPMTTSVEPMKPLVPARATPAAPAVPDRAESLSEATAADLAKKREELQKQIDQAKATQAAETKKVSFADEIQQKLKERREALQGNIDKYKADVAAAKKDTSTMGQALDSLKKSPLVERRAETLNPVVQAQMDHPLTKAVEAFDTAQVTNLLNQAQTKEQLTASLAIARGLEFSELTSEQAKSLEAIIKLLENKAAQ